MKYAVYDAFTGEFLTRLSPEKEMTWDSFFELDAEGRAVFAEPPDLLFHDKASAQEVARWLAETFEKDGTPVDEIEFRLVEVQEHTVFRTVHSLGEDDE